VQLEHSFTVPVGIEDAWRVLLDIELIAPCMPGAAIDSVDGDDFTGTVKVKLGPIGLTYKGRASFVEKDEAAHRAVIDARGRDSRGSGTANAKVTATLTESGGSTRVDVLTDLDITGKPAQFGRGVMVDVGNKLIGQFADCLAGKLADGATPAAVPGSPPTPPSETVVSDEPPATTRPRPRPRPRKAAAGSAEKSAAAPAAATAPPAEATRSKPAAAAPAGAAPAAETAPAAGAPVAAAPAAGAPAAESPAAAAPVTTPAAAPAAEAQSPPSPKRPLAAVSSAPRQNQPAPRRTAAEVEPIDLVASAGPALAKRLAPLVGVVLLLILIARRLRR